MSPKIKLTFLTLFILLITASCTNFSLSPEPTPVPTLSPEKQYAVEMGKILIMIENHKNGAEKDWNLLLAKPIGHKMSVIGVDSSNSTYGVLLNSIFSALDYPLVFEMYFSDKDNLDEFKTLSDASQAVIDSAFDIQVALGGIDVPTSMSVPHREVESCLESISSYHSLLNKILGGRIPTETDLSNLQENSCDKFDLSLKKIQQYIDEQSADSGG